jgi:hypothetical protein
VRDDARLADRAACRSAPLRKVWTGDLTVCIHARRAAGGCILQQLYQNLGIARVLGWELPEVAVQSSRADQRFLASAPP